MKALQHSYISTPVYTTPKKNILTRFANWCASQEKNRIGWLAVMLAGHGCFITPLTLFFIMISGNNMIFWPFAIAAMTMTLVVNLAALPARITIPVFFFSLIIDLVIIINCFAIAINI